MNIRKRIAAWLDPEAAKDARRYWYLRIKLSDAADWLGHDFPMVDAAIHWAKVCDVVHFSALGDNLPAHVPGKPWIHGIQDFREHLRKTYPSTPTTGGAGR